MKNKKRFVRQKHRNFGQKMTGNDHTLDRIHKTKNDRVAVSH